MRVLSLEDFSYDNSKTRRLESAMSQRAEPRLFSNVVVVQATASMAFHVEVFRLRVGSAVVFEAPDVPSVTGTIAAIDESPPSITVDEPDGTSVPFGGDDVFHLLPAATEAASCAAQALSKKPPAKKEEEPGVAARTRSSACAAPRAVARTLRSAKTIFHLDAAQRKK